jgi:hypothetical protein
MAARSHAAQHGGRKLAPDILTLQETVRTCDVHQARRLLGDGFHLAEQEEREAGRAGVPAGQGITTASRWPFGRVFEIDLNLTDRTGDFACTCLVTVLAPQPLGRTWVANHFPDTSSTTSANAGSEPATDRPERKGHAEGAPSWAARIKRQELRSHAPKALSARPAAPLATELGQNGGGSDVVSWGSSGGRDW